MKCVSSRLWRQHWALSPAYCTRVRRSPRRTQSSADYPHAAIKDPIANEGVDRGRRSRCAQGNEQLSHDGEDARTRRARQPRRRHRRRPAHPARRNHHLQDPPAGLRHRLCQRREEPALHLRRQVLHRLFAEARLLRHRRRPRRPTAKCWTPSTTSSASRCRSRTCSVGAKGSNADRSRR